MPYTASAMTSQTNPTPPSSGRPISLDAQRKLVVPDEPIVPFIEGDGTGPDIWAAAVRVIDAAVARAYGGTRKIAWVEVLAGQKASATTWWASRAPSPRPSGAASAA
jgi:isocitrate dehydrogenase